MTETIDRLPIFSGCILTIIFLFLAPLFHSGYDWWDVLLGVDYAIIGAVFGFKLGYIFHRRKIS